MAETPAVAFTATRAPDPQPCIFAPCIATWQHWHGGFPGGYDDPADPDGPPIPFTGPDPNPGAVRDYNGAALVPAWGDSTPFKDGTPFKHEFEPDPNILAGVPCTHCGHVRGEKVFHPHG